MPGGSNQVDRCLALAHTNAPDVHMPCLPTEKLTGGPAVTTCVSDHVIMSTPQLMSSACRPAPQLGPIVGLAHNMHLASRSLSGFPGWGSWAAEPAAM